MHLKTIKLRGFKSFVDPVEVRLEPGVAVVVGPNGSGKSNISDAILWATGSLSPHEVYAVTAFILARNGIVPSTAVLTARTLPLVRMPARDRFVPDDRTGGPQVR